MSELKHWLDEASEADEFERSILRAGLQADPPRATQDRVWSSLVGALAVAPIVAGTTTATAVPTAVTGIGKASVVALAVAKGFLVGLAIYGAAEGVTALADRFSLPPRPTKAQQAIPLRRTVEGKPSIAAVAAPLTGVSAPASGAGQEASEAPHPTPRGNESTKTVAPETASSERAMPSVATFDDVLHSSSARLSQLEAETRALRRARGQLRAGNLADAFASLAASEREFPAPELYQEREALMIELLHRSGRRADARQRAQAFLIRFPDSPHAQPIRSFAAN